MNEIECQYPLPLNNMNAIIVYPLSWTLSKQNLSSWITHRFKQAIEQIWPKILHIGSYPRHAKTPVGPNAPSHKSDRIREGWRGFDIPGSLSHRQTAMYLWLICQQGHPREQAHQNRRGSSDCFIRPLALGFYAQVSAHFLKSDFDLPAANKPLQDL